MAKELQCDAPTGSTVYAQIRRRTDGQVWDTSGTPAFEAYSTASISTYAITMTEAGTASGYFTGDMPAAAAGLYDAIYFIRAGGSPAETDTKVSIEQIQWSGTAPLSLNVIPLVTLVTTTTNLTNLPAITAGWITAAGIADNAIDTATFAAGTTIPRCTLVDTVTTLTNTVTLADGSLTTAKLGTFALAKTTNITGFNDIAATAIVSAGAITTSAGAVSTVTTTTTATNLTNAPTSGDFTATMKSSIGTAVAASAVASVTGNVGGNVTGSVGSVAGNVGGNVVGSVGSVAGNVSGTVASVVGNVGGNVTGSVGGVAANGITASSLAADAGTEIATAVWVSGTRTLSAFSFTVDANVTDWGGASVFISGEGYPVVSVHDIRDNASGNYYGITIADNLVSATVASGGIVAASFAANSITTSALAADAVTEIASGVWSVAVPGAFAAGTAGFILGTYVTAAAPTAAENAAAVAAQITTDHGAGSYQTATGFSTLTEANVRTAVGLATANLDTQLADLPTVAEFEARTIVAANYAQAVKMRKNVAFPGFKFPMRTTAGAVGVGLTVTARRIIDAGAIAACTNAVTEVSNGTYRLDLSAADLNGDDIMFIFTATGALQLEMKVTTQP